MTTKVNKPFRTILDPPKIIETEPGSKIEDVIALRINENGEEEFYVAEKTNVYEKIQAHADDCNIERILQACTNTGDMTYLHQREATYADISEYPGSLIEAQRKIKDAENIFNNLPVNIRAKYNNNFNEYLADFGSENWMKNTGLIKEKAAAAAAAEPMNKPEEGEKE